MAAKNDDEDAVIIDTKQQHQVTISGRTDDADDAAPACYLYQTGDDDDDDDGTEPNARPNDGRCRPMKRNVFEGGNGDAVSSSATTTPLAFPTFFYNCNIIISKTGWVGFVELGKQVTKWRD